jgi:hypothetical protein
MSQSVFDLQSFAGALPLRFGMSPDEVRDILGHDCTESKNFLGGVSLIYYRPGCDANVGFDKVSGLATHFGFGRLSSVRFRGLDVFGDSTAWQSIVRMSVDCHEWVGFIICCDLGLQLSGFHDDDISQLAISVFPEGDYERHRSKFKPYAFAMSAHQQPTKGEQDGGGNSAALRASP